MTDQHSPAPWAYEYNPYTVQRGDDAATELPAFEILDAEQNKIFDTNEDMPSEIQEANARLATAAPAMQEALLLAVLSAISPSSPRQSEQPLGCGLNFRLGHPGAENRS